MSPHDMTAHPQVRRLNDFQQEVNTTSIRAGCDGQNDAPAFITTIQHTRKLYDDIVNN